MSFIFVTCVKIKILRRVPSTRRLLDGDADSSRFDGAKAAASSPRNDLGKDYRVHPTHRLISTQFATPACPTRRCLVEGRRGRVATVFTFAQNKDPMSVTPDVSHVEMWLYAASAAAASASHAATARSDVAVVHDAIAAVRYYDAAHRRLARALVDRFHCFPSAWGQNGGVHAPAEVLVEV